MRDYDDIINMPHHVSATRKHMSMADRAAQFAPFAALTGFGDVIDEAGRLTNERPDMAEDVLEAMDRRMETAKSLQKTVRVEYFMEDERKDGGEIFCAEGRIRSVKRDEGCIKMEDGTVIRIGDITGIDINEDDA